jgi:penicillin-binding protein 2
MSGPQIFFSEVNERQGVFTRRAFLMGGITGAALGALTGRLAQLQLIQNAQYRKAAAENQYNARVIIPPRGIIRDRSGVVLASNRGNFRVMIARDQISDLDTTLDILAELVPITDSKRRAIRRDLVNSPRFTPVSVAEDLTWEQFSAVNLRAPELPGVTAEMGEVRVYPYAGAFAHVIGYVAKINANDLKAVGPNPDRVLLHPGFRIGKQGVERALDLDLRGKPGEQKIEVDARGRVVRAYPQGDIAPVPGKEVVLTLDADVQNRALEVFGEESGAAVVMNCRTGDLICMTSAPSFDANSFVRGLSGPEFTALNTFERTPLLDKAMTGVYPPGSTFKPTTALALLQAGVDPNDRVVCGGGYFYGGRTFRCWKPGGHGSQDMRSAIKNSCDVYFYHMCNRAGVDTIAKTARAMGFHTTYDIGISGQKAGLIPDTAWKRKTFKNDPVWHPGETLSVAIGQGAVTVNALQLAVNVSRIANGQKAIMPRLIRSIGGKEMPSGADVPDLPFPKEHLQIVREGMASVANDPSGTAYRQSQLGLGEVKMAGKTGTAQVRSFDKGGRSSVGVPWKLKDHNLFTAFAPYDNPKYALAVIVQHGGMGGATAGAPRAREIMRMVLLKDPDIRAMVEQPSPLPPEPPPADPGVVEGADPGLPVAAPATPGAPAAAAPSTADMVPR